MMTMKMDMGGAAAVLGFFSAVRAVAPRCRVLGYLPMTDNMSGGDATRPGDVLTLRNGKTVEVLNTDAEGRLILGDALSPGQRGRRPTPSSTSPRSPARSRSRSAAGSPRSLANHDALARPGRGGGGQGG